MNTLHRPSALRQAATIVIVAGVAACSAPLLDEPDPVERGTLTGRAAFGGWRDDAPGVRRHIRPEDVPPVGKSTPSESKVVPRPADALPRVPAGFVVELVASGLAQPRVIRTAPNGDLFIANSKSNEILVCRVLSGNAVPDHLGPFAEGLRKPYGIAFHPPGPEPRWIYVANSDSVVRFPYRNGDLKATGQPERIIEGIQWDHHWTRDIVFSADGSRLYLAVGSGSNVALDMFPEPREPKGLEAWNAANPLGATWDTEELRANILSYTPEGQDRRVFATGLRNPSGIALQPGSGKLWAVVNERDLLGDDGPFEFATHVDEGRFYGWPWYYIGDHEDPRHRGKRPDLKGKVTVPDVLIQAHSAAMQIAFYDGEAFPLEYQGSAFVTLHGSWDRSPRTGYKVIRLLFDESGTPTGEYEDFMTGFVISDEQVWGRPVGVTVARDGSLFVTDDGNGTIWRVRFAG